MRMFEEFQFLKHKVHLIHTIIIFLGHFIDAFSSIWINRFTSLGKVLIELVMCLEEQPVDSVMLSLHTNL
jgi:hypothetical protein